MGLREIFFFEILILCSFAVANAADLNITGSGVYVNGGILSAVNGITVTGATLEIDTGGVVNMGSGSTLLINGGTLYTDGTNDAYPQSTANKAQITNAGGTTTWTFTATSGVVDLTGFLIDWLDVNGLNIGGTTQINHLDGGQLRNLSQTYTSVEAIEISTTGTIPATATNFGWNWGPSNTPPGPLIAYQLANSTGCASQTITFNQWFGDFFQAVNTPNPQTKVTEVTCTIIISPSASPVDIINFKATAFNNSVRLDWQTGLAQGHQGFNVYRSLKSDTGYTQINSSLVKASPGGTTPHGVYVYSDSSVQNGFTYYYKIEDVDTNNIKTMFGPVNATPSGTLGKPWRKKLPWIPQLNLGSLNLGNSSDPSELTPPLPMPTLSAIVPASISAPPPLKIGPLVSLPGMACSAHDIYNSRSSLALNRSGQSLLVWPQEGRMCFQLSTPRGSKTMAFVPPATNQFGSPDKPRAGFNTDGTGIVIFNFSAAQSPVVGVVFDANSLKFGDASILSTYANEAHGTMSYAHDVFVDPAGGVYAYWGTSPNILYWLQHWNMTPTPIDLATYWWSEIPDYKSLDWTQSESKLIPVNALEVSAPYKISPSNFSCSYAGALPNPGGTCSDLAEKSVSAKFSGGTISVGNDNSQTGCPLMVRKYDLSGNQIGEGVKIKNSYFGLHPALDVNSSGQSFISWENKVQGPKQILYSFYDGQSNVATPGLPLVQPECSNFNLPWGKVYSSPVYPKVRMNSDGTGLLTFTMSQNRIGPEDSARGSHMKSLGLYEVKFDFQKKMFSRVKPLTSKTTGD